MMVCDPLPEAPVSADLMLEETAAARDAVYMKAKARLVMIEIAPRMRPAIDRPLGRNFRVTPIPPKITASSPRNQEPKPTRGSRPSTKAQIPKMRAVIPKPLL